MAGPDADMQLLLSSFEDLAPTVISYSVDPYANERWLMDISGVLVDFDNRRDYYVVDGSRVSFSWADSDSRSIVDAVHTGLETEKLC